MQIAERLVHDHSKEHKLQDTSVMWQARASLNTLVSHVIDLSSIFVMIAQIRMHAFLYIKHGHMKSHTSSTLASARSISAPLTHDTVFSDVIAAGPSACGRARTGATAGR